MQFRQAFLAIASTLAMFTAQARDFRASDVHPLDYPTVLMMKKMGDIISQKTNGKYNIKVFGNSTLGSENDAAQQVKIGALDMTRVGSAAFNAIIPETLVPGLPFLFRDIEHFRKAMYGPVGDKVLAAFEKHGFIGLVILESGTRSIYASKPVRNLADAKGMKIRVQISDLWVDLIKAMGASPTPIPYAEIYTAIKTGLVDAAENNYPSYESQKHYEVAPIYSETQHVLYYEIIAFSKRVWDTLSAEEQKIIRDAAREALPYYVEEWNKRLQASKEVTVKGGAQYVDDVDRAEFAAAMKPVWDKYTPTPETKALLQEIIDTK
jgi:tripartite ATP-independent transporter DctP family solute receptor